MSHRSSTSCGRFSAAQDWSACNLWGTCWGNLRDNSARRRDWTPSNNNDTSMIWTIYQRWHFHDITDKLFSFINNINSQISQQHESDCFMIHVTSNFNSKLRCSIKKRYLFDIWLIDVLLYYSPNYCIQLLLNFALYYECFRLQ